MSISATHASGDVDNLSVEFRPRLPVAWHSFNERTILG